MITSNLKWKSSLIPFILIFTFISGQLLLKEHDMKIVGVSDFFAANTRIYVNLVFRYLFIFFLVNILTNRKLNFELANKMFRFLEILFIINSIFVIIGLFTNLDIFRVYPGSERFGYSGLINSFYLNSFLIVYWYREYRETGNKKMHLIFGIMIALLLGKKAVFIFLFLVGFYHVYAKLKWKLKNVGLLLVSSAALLYFVKDELLKLVIKWIPFWRDLYEKEGWLAVLSSTRSMRFQNLVEHINKDWSWGNYIVGGLHFPKWVEIEPVALYAFFGIPGLIIFGGVFYKLLKIVNKLDALLLGIVLFLAVLMGGFLLDVYTIFFFVLLVYVFKSKENSDKIAVVIDSSIKSVKPILNENEN